MIIRALGRHSLVRRHRIVYPSPPFFPVKHFPFLNTTTVAAVTMASSSAAIPADDPANSTAMLPRPTRSLHNRTAIVTGAGSEPTNGIGNGRAASVLLAEAGANVLCVDINLGLAERTASIINTAPNHGKAVAFAGDVTKAEQCAAIVAHAMATFGRLDILVNNVGILGAKGTAVDVDIAAWQRSMDVNVTSMVLMAKYAIPEMIKNDEPGQMYKGSIVNIGSVAGLQGGTPSNLVYPTSKGAVINLTRAMASHHAPEGIRVNCVCPGMLYTPMVYGGGMTDQVRTSRRNRSLLKTEGNGWDTGAAVRFLAGDEARWITGVILPVDAGTTASTEIDLGTANG